MLKELRACTRAVCVVKTARLLHSHRDAQNMQDSYLIDFCGLIFTDTSPYHDLI